MKKKAAKKKPTPPSAAALKAKFETLKASHAARVKQREASQGETLGIISVPIGGVWRKAYAVAVPTAETETVPEKQGDYEIEKPTKPGYPSIHRWKEGGKVVRTITAWPSPAISLQELATGERSVFLRMGSEIEKRYHVLSGSAPPEIERKREYLKRDASGNYVYPENERLKMATDEEIEASKRREKFTPADKAREAINSVGGEAIADVCLLFKNLHAGDFHPIESAIAELHGQPDAPIERVICAEAGKKLYAEFGDDFALLFNSDEGHRQRAAERLKVTFSAVFDHLARARKPLPASRSRKGKFIRNKPREIVLIKETMRLVKEELKLPTKDRLKGLFKGTLPASTWTDLFRNAGLQDLPSEVPFAKSKVIRK